MKSTFYKILNFIKAHFLYQTELVCVEKLKIEYRKKLSVDLQKFEAEFQYPLGNQFFKIVHGKEKGYDYFSFFEQLGKPYFLLLKKRKSSEIIACVGLVLREINLEKSNTTSEKQDKKHLKNHLNKHFIWYLCDYKIAKTHQRKKLYRLFLYRYFLFFYCKCRYFFAINMKGQQKNGLVKQLKGMFSVFQIKTEKLFLHQTNQHFDENNHLAIDNFGQKDISIENSVMPLHHLIFSDNCDDNSNKIRLNHNFKNIHAISSIKPIKSDTPTTFMWIESQASSNINVQEITLIHNFQNQLNWILSTAEI